MVVTAHCVLYKDLLGNVVTYLLGGADGRLVLVVVRLNSQAVVDEAGGDKKPPCRINIEFIGIASAAQTVCFIAILLEEFDKIQPIFQFDNCFFASFLFSI
jgi:hypothetical protein